MDDEDVALQFTADVAEAVAAVEELRDATQELAVSAQETQAGLDAVRDSSVEAGAASDELRGRLAEVAAAAGIYRDEMGRLRDAQGKFIAESVLEDLALGKTRDEALEAAAAMKALKDAQSGGGGGGPGGGGGRAGRGLSAGAGGGLSGALSGVPLLGSLAEAPELLGAVIPLVMVVAAEVAALATGFAAAGLGVASFAALAAPAFKQVFGALGDTKEQLAKLPAPVREAVNGVKSLGNSFSAMSKAFEPTALKVLNQLLGIANQLLPYVGQFAKAAAPAIEGLLSNLSKGLDSASFKHFMQFLEQLAGPVITAVGSGMAGLAKEVMHLMETFSEKDVINSVNIAFRLLGTAVRIVYAIIKSGMIDWDFLTQTLPHLVTASFHVITGAFHDIAHAFDTARHTVASWGHDVAHTFDTVRHDAAAVGNAVVHPIEAAFNWVKGHWKLIVSALVDPVGTAVMEIRSHTHQISQAFDGMRHDTASVLAGARHDIASAFDNVRHSIAAAVHAIPGTVKNSFNDAYRIIRTVDSEILRAMRAAWDAAVNAVAAAIRGVLRFFERLPGQIAGALAGLPGRMLGIGRNIITGLIHGIISAASAIPSLMGSLASDVASYFTDPLKLFSPSRLFFEHGFNIVQGAINGVKANVPQLLATMRGLGTDVAGVGLTVNSAMAASAVQAVPAVPPGSGAATVNANVTVHAQGAVGVDYSNPRYQQALQQAVQEATLRYAQMNPNSGLTPGWGR